MQADLSTRARLAEGDLAPVDFHRGKHFVQSYGLFHREFREQGPVFGDFFGEIPPVVTALLAASTVAGQVARQSHVVGGGVGQRLDVLPAVGRERMGQQRVAMSPIVGVAHRGFSIDSPPDVMQVGRRVKLVGKVSLQNSKTLLGLLHHAPERVEVAFGGVEKKDNHGEVEIDRHDGHQQVGVLKMRMRWNIGRPRLDLFARQTFDLGAR